MLGRQKPVSRDTAQVAALKAASSSGAREEQLDIVGLYDKTGSGKIDREDVASALRALGLNPSEAEVAAMLNEVAPGDAGSVAATTVLDLAQGYRQSLEKKRATGVENGLMPSDQLDPNLLQLVFNVVDGETPGFVGVNELRSLLGGVGEALSEAEINVLLSSLEPSEHGKIAIDDLLKLLGGTSSQ